jgi:ribonuclease P protein component
VPAGHPKLRKPAEFRLVYEEGKRFDGRLMTAFVRRNESGQHRLGITASKRVSRLAVDRNRMKRLLREMFRLSEGTLQGVEPHLDWVLNAKRSLLKVKVADALADFQKIVVSVAHSGRVGGQDGGRRTDGSNEQSKL